MSTGCYTCGGGMGKHDPIAHDQYSDEAIGGLGSGPRYPAPEPDWHCICGSGDDGEMHSAMCVASNTPDDEWYGDYPPRECDHDNGECHNIEHQK